jgi:hypothetical protein
MVPIGVFTNADIMGMLSPGEPPRVRIAFEDGTPAPEPVIECFVFRLVEDASATNWVSYPGLLQEGTPMPTNQEPKYCLCGCGTHTRRRFAPGHDMTHLKQCLDRISANDPTGADDLEKDNPGHADRYDMGCLRANIGQKREVLQQCFRG